MDESGQNTLGRLFVVAMAGPPGTIGSRGMRRAGEASTRGEVVSWEEAKRLLDDVP